MEVIAQYKMMGNRPRKSGRSKRFMFCAIGDASVIVPGCAHRRKQEDTIEEQNKCSHARNA